MAFKLALFELHVFFDAAHRHEPACGSVCFDREARNSLFLLKSYGVTNVIVSAMPSGTIGFIDLTGVEGMVNRMRIHIPDRGRAIRDLLECYDVSPNDTLYVDDIARGIGEANPTRVATFGLTCGYDTESRIRKEKPLWIGHSLIEVASVASAQRAAY